MGICALPRQVDRLDGQPHTRGVTYVYIHSHIICIYMNMTVCTYAYTCIGALLRQVDMLDGQPHQRRQPTTHAGERRPAARPPTTDTRTRTTTLPESCREACDSYVDYLEAYIDYSDRADLKAVHICDLDVSQMAPLPPEFQAQLRRMYWLTIFWLAAGATNISNIIACFAIFWADTWQASPKDAGLLLVAGELAGLATLYASTLWRPDALEAMAIEEESDSDDEGGDLSDASWSSLREDCHEGHGNGDAGHGHDRAGESAPGGLSEVAIDGADDAAAAPTGCGQRCLRSYVADQPCLQLWAAVLVVFSSAVLGFSAPTAGASSAAGGPSVAPALYALHVVAVLCASVGNALCHASGCENMVSYLPHNLFLPALRRGYMLKRITNSVQAACTTALYALSPQLPFVLVFAFYTLVYLPSLLWAFVAAFRLLPHQRARQAPVMDGILSQARQEEIAELGRRAAAIARGPGKGLGRRRQSSVSSPKRSSVSFTRRRQLSGQRSLREMGAMY